MPTLAAVLAAGAILLVGPAQAKPDGPSPPDWAQSCGLGRYYVGDLVAFGHPVEFTTAIDSDRGYLADCYTGTEAYLEFQYQSDGWYVYAVWGQLGEYQ